MKRIQVRPGKSVVVSAELADKAERIFRAIAYTREEAERIAAAEPRGATVYAGPLSKTPAKRRAKVATRSK